MTRTVQSEKIKKMVVTSLFAALIFVLPPISMYLQVQAILTQVTDSSISLQVYSHCLMQSLPELSAVLSPTGFRDFLSGYLLLSL